MAGGLNLYGYAGGDPINSSDPFGLCPPLDTNLGPHCYGWAGFGAALSPLWTYPQQAIDDLAAVAGAAGDFGRNYRDMREANTIGADKYFHAKANCEAAQRGPAGAATARRISDARETTDQMKGDSPEASEADQQANRDGRAAGTANPNGNCASLVSKYRPNGLDTKYE